MSFDPQALAWLAAAAADIRAHAAEQTQDLPSPCISVCKMDPDTGLCLGCLRTLDEIGQWGSAPEARKREIWNNIEARGAHLSA